MKIETLRFVSLVLLSIVFIPAVSFAQFDNKSERLSLPQKVSANVEGAKIVIEYGAPEVKNRKIFGGLVPYGKLWRTGANEATTIEVSEKIAVNGKELDQGKYAVFTIPGDQEWTVIFNSEFDQWGDFNYDEKMDVLRINVKPEKSEFHETMTFDVTNDGKMNLYWENLRVPIQIHSLEK